MPTPRNGRRSVSISQSSGSGSTTPGALKITIYNSGAGAGTVDSVSVAAGDGWVFDEGPYDPISYDATGTTFDIVEETLSYV